MARVIREDLARDLALRRREAAGAAVLAEHGWYALPEADLVIEPPQRVAVKSRSERFQAEAHEQRMLQRVAAHPVQAAEAPWVVEPEAAAGIEHKVHMVVGDGQDATVQHAEAARHAEVDD